MRHAVPRRAFVRNVALLLALGAAISAQASHAWGGYHWARTSNPFTLKAGKNLNAKWEAHLDRAIADWNRSSVLDLVKVPGGTRPKSCRPTAGRIEVCNASYGNTGWLGIAQIWITGGTHITQGVAKVNDYYFNQPRYNTDSWRQLVMCQEVAHDFGLDHQDENFDNPNLGTCMDYTSDPDGPPSNTGPDQHDFDQLINIYSHVDATTTVGQATTSHPPAMTDLDLDGPAAWGRLVRSGNGGRTQVFTQDFGHGHRVVTYVIWADGVGRGNRGE